MARKSTNKNKKESRSPRSPRAPWLPDRATFMRVLTTGTTIVLFLALSIGLLVGRGPMRARAAEVVREPVQVLFEWPPLTPGASAQGSGAGPSTWLDVNTQDHLQALAGQHLSADPFDAVGLARARETLARTGWFASGPVLKRESAGVVRVEGKWRVPFAVVRVGGDDHLVTVRGERLDKTYSAGSSRLPIVLGATQPAPGRLGEVWSGTDVHAGLALLATLRARVWFPQVAAVSVADFAPKNRRRLVIISQQGGRILWGGPVDPPLPGEQATAVKLRHLDNQVARTGKLDAGTTFLMDIRGKDVFLEDLGAVQSGQ